LAPNIFFFGAKRDSGELAELVSAGSFPAHVLPSRASLVWYLHSSGDPGAFAYPVAGRPLELVRINFPVRLLVSLKLTISTSPFPELDCPGSKLCARLCARLPL
jgi:hypothetical protein